MLRCTSNLSLYSPGRCHATKCPQYSRTFLILRKLEDHGELRRYTLCIHVVTIKASFVCSPCIQDSVRVACRFRPINQRERDEGQSDVVIEILGGGTQVKYRGKKTQSFSFDRAFPTNCTQQDVFDHTGALLVDQVLQGINCTLFAYGQTGSG